jgi:putative ABC transport system permease protein
MAPLHRKLFRSLLENWGQALAVVAVVASGIACYVCIHSAYFNLRLTRDTYYAKHRLADFEIVLDRAPEGAVFEVEAMPGVRRARARIVQEVSVDVDGLDEPRSGRLISMPVPRREVINDIVVTQGRYFDGASTNEVIVSERFATSNGLKVGDWLQVSIERKKYPLKIIGFGLSPEYVYMIRNVQELFPAPERFGILWAPDGFVESALGMQAACNNIVGLMDDPTQTTALFDIIDKTMKPYGLMAKVKQEDQISARFLADEIKGLGVTATITPGIFLGIAALILLVLLNRMVRMERTQVGLLKAGGYSDLAIAWHYVEYALLLCMGGCVLGAAGGQWLAGLIIKMYIQFYQFPLLESRVYPEVIGRSMLFCAACGLVGAVSAARGAAAIHPAEAMRPESPRGVHKVWLEYLPSTWRMLPFTWKMVMRNISRNRVRAGITVAGVAISTGLIIMSFFGMDAMYYMLRFQFEEVQREDARIAFYVERGKDALHESARFPFVRRAEPVLEYPFTIRNGHRKKDIVVTGLEPGSELRKVLDVDGNALQMEGPGIVLADRLARDLGVRAGDTLRLEPLMGRVEGARTVTVSRVAQQYLGAGAFMELSALSRLLESDYLVNAALLRIDEGEGAALKRELKDIAAVSSVTFNKEGYQGLLDTLGASMQISNGIQLGFAGIIGFAIIYNVMSVSLAERRRELASLRVLGLTARETGSILYNESILLSIVGLVLGIPLGMFICRLLVYAYDTDLYRLPYHVERGSYASSVLVSALFVLLANALMWRHIRRLDLVEVLKERE